jgi:hypothetical protein
LQGTTEASQVKFILEIELDDDAANATQELERILRYWGGNLRHYELTPGTGSAVYDSSYHEVGRWTITDFPEPDASPAAG